MQTLMGYPRSDGRFGIRNYVIVISLVQCANGTVTKIANACDVAPITIDTGCGDYEAAANKVNLGLIRAGQHPNVYGVLLVSLGCQWINADEIAAEIAKCGKRVEHICIQDEGGMKNSVAKGIALVEDMKKEAAAQQRVEFPMRDLVVGLNAGGSDWTSGIAANISVGAASDLVWEKGGGSIIGGGVRFIPGDERYHCDRAVTYEAGLAVLDALDEYCHDLIEFTGQSVSEVNPTPGNKAGGITTLAEKAMGTVKLHGHVPLSGVLQTGDHVPHPGGWFLDERHGANDMYSTTACAMTGAHVMFLTTGRGTPHGNAVMPVIKVTGNPETARRLEEFIDYSCGDILSAKKTPQQCGQELFELLVEVCNGKEIKAEENGDWSYGIPPAGRF